MIRCLTGKPRAGKTAACIWQLILTLGTTRLPIITNMDSLRLEPWVDGRGKARLGLKNVLRKLYGSDCDIDRRLVILTEPAQIRRFFMCRPVIPKDEQEPREIKWLSPVDGKFSIGSEPVIAAFIDEAHIAFPGVSVTGGVTDRDHEQLLLSYCSQAARCGDQVFIISQVMNNVSKRIRDCSQDCTYITNRRHRAIGWFRDQDKISFALYSSTPPKDGEEPLQPGTYKYPRELVYSSYDTSAGQGVAVGGRPADLNERASGLPLWTIPVFGVVAIIAVYFLIGFINAGFGALSRKLFYGSTPKPAATNSVALNTNTVPQTHKQIDFANLLPKKDAPPPSTPPVQSAVNSPAASNSLPSIKSFATLASSGNGSTETLSVVVLSSGLSVYGSKLKVTGDSVTLDGVSYRYEP